MLEASPHVIHLESILDCREAQLCGRLAQQRLESCLVEMPVVSERSRKSLLFHD
jgi:hypothetical protein